MQRDYRWIEKPARIKDPTAIEAARKDYCEYCGIPKGPFHCHHVKSVGSGGPDATANLVNLCWLCHHHVHAGRIPSAKINALVEARELVRKQSGTLACVCGDARLIWIAAQGVFRCYKCDEIVGPILPAASSPPPERG